MLTLSRGEVGQRSETVRRANLSALVRELHVHGPLSRSELVARTGLTRSAIRGHVGELAEGGIVSEQSPGPLGTPGRPSPLVHLNAGAAEVLALEISVDSLAAARVGLGGEVMRRVRVDRPRGHSSADDIAADLGDLARQVRWHDDCDGEIGVGVAIVGVVRRYDGLVSMAPNLGWRDVPLAERLERTVGRSHPIAVANDADLGALAEARRGAARGVDDVIYVSGEVGVGAGIIVDGVPLTGVDGYAGEVGHFPVNPTGSLCRCGAIGCWETEIGERPLLKRAGRDPDGGRRAVDRVFEEAAVGSPDALRALDEVGRWLGTGLAGLINVFNPSRIVLGGLLGRIHPFVSARIEQELDRRALAGPRHDVQVVPAQLIVDAPLIGAAELAFGPFLADPAAWLPSRVDSAEPVAVPAAV